jgi:hypothetical protein
VSRVVVASILAALVACPAAAAHGGGAALGYRSTVVHVTPDVSGLVVRVVDGDDELELTNTAGREIVIKGYEDEPYLRFTREGVYENQRSPAAYLNDDRFANVDVPATADPKAAPDWKIVAAGVQYGWHDHRVHWMSPALPPNVRAAKNVEHHIFDWRVPGTIDGERLVIAGSLDYSPPESGSSTLVVITWVTSIVAIVVAISAILAWIFVRRRRR